MIPFTNFFIGFGVLVFFNTITCLHIAKNRSLHYSVRWFWSMLVLMLPIVGTVLFKIVEGRLRANSYMFFSEEFIDRVLYRSVKDRF